MNDFKSLGLSDVTVEMLVKRGFTKPTSIQQKTIPILLSGEHDVVAKAQTGTGKTACFALPILENLKRSGVVQALVLAPTRELAVQVTNEIISLRGDREVRVTTIYGGASIRDQMDELRRGVDIVVGTPGRVIDLINRKKLDIRNISYAVLDEADEMLNMGFVEDIEEILSQTSQDKKMLMFSATMPKEILHIAKRFMKDYELVTIEEDSLPTELIDQVYFEIMAKDRYEAVRRIVVVVPDFHGIIFCKTKIDVDGLAHKLVEDGYSAAALHGDISQSQRENILKQFKAKRIRVLIATDVAARGIDVNDLNVVINYSLPQSPELYIHRIGRTGRMGNKGTAITFLIPSERGRLKYVERLINQKIDRGELPTVEMIIEAKKFQIESKVEGLIKAKSSGSYVDIAKRLLETNDQVEVVSSVLRLAFGKELDPEGYKDIERVSERGEGSEGGRRRQRGGRQVAERAGHSGKPGNFPKRRDSGGNYKRRPGQERASSQNTEGGSVSRKSSDGGSSDRKSKPGNYPKSRKRDSSAGKKYKSGPYGRKGNRSSKKRY